MSNREMATEIFDLLESAIQDDDTFMYGLQDELDQINSQLGQTVFEAQYNQDTQKIQSVYVSPLNNKDEFEISIDNYRLNTSIKDISNIIGDK